MGFTILMGSSYTQSGVDWSGESLLWFECIKWVRCGSSPWDCSVTIQIFTLVPERVVWPRLVPTQNCLSHKQIDLAFGLKVRQVFPSSPKLLCHWTYVGSVARLRAWCRFWLQLELRFGAVRFVLGRNRTGHKFQGCSQNRHISVISSLTWPISFSLWMKVYELK